MTVPSKPDAFLLSIWSDVPDPGDSGTFSHPGQKLWEYEATDVHEVMVGYDKYPHGEPNEPVFRYSVRLPEDNWFQQDTTEAVYWFGVIAVYEDANAVVYPWGWTNHMHVFNDDAVGGELIDDLWQWQPLKDQTGAGADMSFMLFTEVGLPETEPNETNISGMIALKSDFRDNWYAGINHVNLVVVTPDYKPEMDSCRFHLQDHGDGTYCLQSLSMGMYVGAVQEEGTDKGKLQLKNQPVNLKLIDVGNDQFVMQVYMSNDGQWKYVKAVSNWHLIAYEDSIGEATRFTLEYIQM
jgi:hypothetical protein